MGGGEIPFREMKKAPHLFKAPVPTTEQVAVCPTNKIKVMATERLGNDAICKTVGTDGKCGVQTIADCLHLRVKNNSVVLKQRGKCTASLAGSVRRRWGKNISSPLGKMAGKMKSESEWQSKRCLVTFFYLSRCLGETAFTLTQQCGDKWRLFR